ncbi:MAG: thiamine-phosphate kinase [Chitinophagales bacterium]|nr:thiamine-phosphate kinase [Chitinophagales bacterium]MDW8273700.1 thiamine-phosphate kinase [Chitinophagales bacterium]
MSTTKTPISELGEFGLIEHLTRKFQCINNSTLKGVGDDGAVIDYNGDKIVVSSDLLAEGIHFDLMYTPLKHLGYKSIVVNLSDIYAMNARPEQVLVNVALSSKFTVEAVSEIYSGIELACKRYGVDLVGGDTTSSRSGLIISVTAIGRATKEKIVYRSGAKPGDLICVSGDLGAAFLGLQILEREKQIWLEHPEVQPELNKAYLLERQLKPEARKDIIELLDELFLLPTAMLDVSDGLASDILHLCKQSNVGCLIEEALVPIADETYHTALEMNFDPIVCALNGGEDYELLFTISPEDETKITNEIAFSVIGTITEPEKGKHLKTKAGNLYQITAQGWKHF